MNELKKTQVEQLILVRDRYQARGTYAAGTIRSEVVTGFEIPARAVFDPWLNLTALTQIVAP